MTESAEIRDAIFQACIDNASVNLTEDAIEAQSERITNAIMKLKRLQQLQFAQSTRETLLAEDNERLRLRADKIATFYVKRWRTLVPLPRRYADEILDALRQEPASTIPQADRS